MDPIAMAQAVTGAVDRLRAKARQLYYAVILMAHRCPQCGGDLRMTGESRCRCLTCGGIFDPTLEYQRCPDCGGSLRLRVCRYHCTACGADVPSRFVFDGRVFDAEYFRHAMIRCRQRKREQREQLREAVTENRSKAFQLPEADVASVPGLVDALDSLVGGPASTAFPLDLASRFDLHRYERHVQAHTGPFETAFDEIPSLAEDARKDRIWRFVAVVFLAHAGLIRICQEGQEIWVSKVGTD